jgi:hypothetical protein
VKYIFHILELGKPRVKDPTSGEGLLAKSAYGRHRRAREDKRVTNLSFYKEPTGEIANQPPVIVNTLPQSWH